MLLLHVWALARRASLRTVRRGVLRTFGDNHWTELNWTELLSSLIDLVFKKGSLDFTNTKTKSIHVAVDASRSLYTFSLSPILAYLRIAFCNVKKTKQLLVAYLRVAFCNVKKTKQGLHPSLLDLSFWHGVFRKDKLQYPRYFPCSVSCSVFSCW